MGRGMVAESRFGVMGRSTRGTGIVIWLMGEEDLFMQMEMFSKEIGSMIKHMVREFTFIGRELAIQVSGTRINK